MRISRQTFQVKQLENAESFKYADSILTNEKRRTCEIK
jgi:hypothetical protein